VHDLVRTYIQIFPSTQLTFQLVFCFIFLFFSNSPGMLAPMLVQMERQIDREIAADNKAAGVGFGTQTDDGTNTVSTGTENDEMFDSDSEDEEETSGPLLMYGPQPQIVTNDLKSLDEMVSS
jgi:growth arrest-specific protein 2